MLSTTRRRAASAASLFEIVASGQTAGEATSWALSTAGIEVGDLVVLNFQTSNNAFIPTFGLGSSNYVQGGTSAVQFALRHTTYAFIVTGTPPANYTANSSDGNKTAVLQMVAIRPPPRRAWVDARNDVILSGRASSGSLTLSNRSPDDGDVLVVARAKQQTGSADSNALSCEQGELELQQGYFSSYFDFATALWVLPTFTLAGLSTAVSLPYGYNNTSLSGWAGVFSLEDA